MTDLYAALEVPADADDAAIKRAYRKAASKHHPDREGGDEERMKLVQRAYSVLSNAEQRKRYDEGGDDTASGDPVAELLQVLMQLALQLIDARDVNYTDIVAKMRQAVVAQKEQALTQRTRQATIVEKRENAIRRIVRKDGSANILVDMLSNEIEKMKRAMAATEADIAKFDSLFALIDGYEYRAEKQQAMPDPRSQYAGLGSIFGVRPW